MSLMIRVNEGQLNCSIFWFSFFSKTAFLRFSLFGDLFQEAVKDGLQAIQVPESFLVIS